jgi:hypothetical protein
MVPPDGQVDQRVLVPFDVHRSLNDKGGDVAGSTVDVIQRVSSVYLSR